MSAGEVLGLFFAYFVGFSLVLFGLAYFGCLFYYLFIAPPPPKPDASSEAQSVSEWLGQHAIVLDDENTQDKSG